MTSIIFPSLKEIQREYFYNSQFASLLTTHLIMTSRPKTCFAKTIFQDNVIQTLAINDS